MTELNRDNLNEYLSAYIDDELDESERAEVERLLRADPAVRSRLEALRQTVNLVNALPRQNAPPDLLDDLTNRAERELLRAMLKNDPRLGDTEIDSELFADGPYGEAHGLLARALADLPAGQPLDLGELLGEGDDHVGTLLRGLALDDRSPEDPVGRAEQRPDSRAWEVRGCPALHPPLLAPIPATPYPFSLIESSQPGDWHERSTHRPVRPRHWTGNPGFGCHCIRRPPVRSGRPILL